MNKHDDTRNEKRGPDMVAYSVQSYGKDQSAWNRIGAAFSHRDGEGYDVILHAMPLDGRVTLREQRMEAYKDNRQKAESPKRGRRRDRRAR